MFVVVAVQAKQFPVAPVCRIVIVIVILVVDGQFAQAGTLKFTAAACADVWEHAQRAGAVALFPGTSFPHEVGVQSRLFIGDCGFLSRCHKCGEDSMFAKSGKSPCASQANAASVPRGPDKQGFSMWGDNDGEMTMKGRGFSRSSSLNSRGA